MAFSSSSHGELIKDGESVLTGLYIASDPAIIYDGNLYRMFYTDGMDAGSIHPVIREAVSADGYSWMPLGGNVMPSTVVSGVSGTDYANVETAGAFKAGDSTVLLYSAYVDTGSLMPYIPAKLYAVQSTDGEMFGDPSWDPVLAPTPGWYDNDGIYSPTVISYAGGYLMIYTGHAYTDTSNIGGRAGVYLLAATSSDGLTWTKHPSPILSSDPSIPWLRDGVAEASLVAGPDGQFYLFFTGLDGDNREIGMASASNPLGPWKIDPEPILTASPAGFDDGFVIAPEAEFVNGVLRLWYTGVSQDGQWAIGYAQSDWSGGSAVPFQRDSIPTWIGSSGDDTIVDGDSASVILTNTGDDAVLAGGGDDVLDGQGGNDILYGEAGNDRITGGDGADVVDGGSEDDQINGGVGNDTLIGGDGLDTIDGGNGADMIDGGNGNDRIAGGIGDDIINAGAGSDFVNGNNGNDVIYGGSENDNLYGESGNDTLIGGAGDDRLDGGEDDDWLVGGEISEFDGAFLPLSGKDTLIGGNGNDALFGFDGDDILRGGAGADYLDGSDGVDNLEGGAGNDTLIGGAGSDLILGGTGDDNVDGGTGADTFTFRDFDGRDVIWNFSRLQGDRLRLDPNLGITSFAGFKASITGFASGGSSYTSVSFASGDELTVVGIAPSGWMSGMVQFA